MSDTERAMQEAAASRRTVGLFRELRRGLIEVRGGDRVRWLDGMVSNDVKSLSPGSERSGCLALLLTRQGRIVADLQILCREEAYWLDLDAAAAAPTRANLEKFLIADDVDLRDESDAFARLALEGPAAPEVLARASGAAIALAPDAGVETRIAGEEVVAAAFGVSGEAAFRIFAARGSATRVADALAEAGASSGLVEAGPEALEILRIEAGVPRYGCELDESVLPAEAGLERAVSTTKGCYTGQEVVARLASRGRVKHRLVGLAAQGDALLPVEAAIEHKGRKLGEVTSACRSPSAGAIGLGYVQRPADEPGTEVVIAARPARVVALPFAATPGAGG